MIKKHYRVAETSLLVFWDSLTTSIVCGGGSTTPNLHLRGTTPFGLVFQFC
jgi:hypothetical protein